MDGCDVRVRRQSCGVLGKRLRDDAQLLEELTYCVPLGIPHSRFLSWSLDDQDKALAFMRYRAEHCPGCGTTRGDWDKDPDAFIADVEICPGCQRIEQENDNAPAKKKGAKVGLLPRAVALAKVEEYAEDGKDKPEQGPEVDSL